MTFHIDPLSWLIGMFTWPVLVGLYVTIYAFIDGLRGINNDPKPEE